AGLADHFGQRCGQPEARMEAEPGEVGAEARLRAGDAEVGHQREPQPAADGRAVNGADDRLARAEETDRLHVEMSGRLDRLARPPAFGVEGAAVAEIGACAERLALRRQHHGAATAILIERLERVGDLPDQGDVEEIVRRPPDLDEGDEARFVHDDILERSHLTFLPFAYARASSSRFARYSIITRMVRAQLRALVNSG